MHDVALISTSKYTYLYAYNSLFVLYIDFRFGILCLSTRRSFLTMDINNTNHIKSFQQSLIQNKSAVYHAFWHVRRWLGRRWFDPIIYIFLNPKPWTYQDITSAIYQFPLHHKLRIPFSIPWLVVVVAAASYNRNWNEFQYCFEFLMSYILIWITFCDALCSATTYYDTIIINHHICRFVLID